MSWFQLPCLTRGYFWSYHFFFIVDFYLQKPCSCQNNKIKNKRPTLFQQLVCYICQVQSHQTMLNGVLTICFCFKTEGSIQQSRPYILWMFPFLVRALCGQSLDHTVVIIILPSFNIRYGQPYSFFIYLLILKKTLLKI